MRRWSSMESVCKREDMPAITTLAYKRNFREVLPRLQSLYGRAAGDRLFATMDIYPMRPWPALPRATRPPHAAIPIWTSGPAFGTNCSRTGPQSTTTPCRWLT